MGSLFINAWQENDCVYVSVQSFVITYVYDVSKSPNVTLNINFCSEKPTGSLLQIDFNDLTYDVVNDLPELPQYCLWPVLILENSVISGLCSVARQIVKLCPDNKIRSLLGFREASLVACAESSVWTKFCEVDIIHSVEKLLNDNFINFEVLTLPENVVKFEHHLSKPVRIHNIYNIARKNLNDKSLSSKTPREKLDVHHSFAEGPYMTLADVLLFPCFRIVFLTFSNELLQSKLPLVSEWYEKVHQCELPPVFNIRNVKKVTVKDIAVGDVEKKSLYNADPTRVLTEKHTRQYKIDEALQLVDDIKAQINNDNIPYGFNVEFDWSKVPLDANPQGGALPKSRAGRKCEQLENLAKAVLKLAEGKRYKIVDFCSGSGHLGILLAYLLPDCKVILVENKERSLARAKETIQKLNLNNVLIVHSNLDYFIGRFDIGVCLHACGVATDLVIEKCILNKANFVCCPCCYGGVKQCHQLTYPRSKKYETLFENNTKFYFNLAHAADQTHEADNVKTRQGYLCMDVIDTDRKLYAMDCGYEVYLGKLQPVSCTNKNNLLVGIYKSI